jgi:hypothetical protein
VDEKESEQVLLLRQIAKWSREAALPAARARVASLLDTDAKKRVYQAIAEGNLTVRALENVAGVGRVTAQNLVTEWEAAGIVVAGSNPPRATFTLAELGIAPPAPKPTPVKGTARA